MLIMLIALQFTGPGGSLGAVGVTLPGFAKKTGAVPLEPTKPENEFTRKTVYPHT